MRRVIDSNCLQDERLSDYLSAKIDNYAVLTDYAAMEAYKGNTLKSIHKSMSLLSMYPKQVLVLKGTQIVCGLKMNGKGLQKRLIDQNQTKEFWKYCKHLKQAESDPSLFKAEIMALGDAANEHMNGLLTNAEEIIKSISEFAQCYTNEELKILRKKQPFNESIKTKFMQHVCLVTDLLFDSHPKTSKIPEFENLHNSYIFRYSLCSCILVMDWIAEGGANNVGLKRIRNDMVDMHFVAYATFFDGLMSKDAKANEIYSVASYIIANEFKA